jgi:hypothetical protein
MLESEFKSMLKDLFKKEVIKISTRITENTHNNGCSGNSEIITTIEIDGEVVMTNVEDFSYLFSFGVFFSYKYH